MFEYELKLSKRRKSVAIKVTPERVIVLAPFKVCQNSLRQWLETKNNWVQSQQSKLQQLPSKQDPLRTRKLLLFGQTYDVDYSNVQKVVVNHEKRSICLPSTLETQQVECRKTLITFLNSQLKEYLNTKLARFSTEMDCSISSVKVREYKSRWGSCNSKQALTFNCLLAGAPTEMIDYVIIHELAHCHVLAHNAQFWMLVEKQYGNYKSARKWFNENSKKLMIE